MAVCGWLAALAAAINENRRQRQLWKCRKTILASLRIVYRSGMGEGRSLLTDSIFLALVREYDKHFDPPVRADGVADVLNGNWYALKLVHGAEHKAIDRVASRMRLPVYLPMEHGRPYRGRGGAWRRDSRPLFPGYGFVRLAQIDRYLGPLRLIPGVLGILTQPDGSPAVMSERLIDDCKRTENSNDKILTAKLKAMQDDATRQWRKECAAARKRHQPLPPCPEPVVIVQKHVITYFQNVQQFGALSILRKPPLAPEDEFHNSP